MADEPNLSLLWRAARRAESDPFCMASALWVYSSTEEADEAELAAFLGCSERGLLSLALCRRPGLAPPADFGEDVAALAGRFALNAERLAQLMRRVELVEAIRQTATSSKEDHPQLLAAEDRGPFSDQEVTPPDTARGDSGGGDDQP